VMKRQIAFDGITETRNRKEGKGPKANG